MRNLSTRPPQAPRVAIDIQHIRANADLHSQNCVDRAYEGLSKYPYHIQEFSNEIKKGEQLAQKLHTRANLVEAEIRSAKSPNNKAEDGNESEAGPASDQTAIAELLEAAREIKEQLQKIEESSKPFAAQIQDFAEALPNLTSDQTPIGHTPRILGHHPGTSRPVTEKHPSSHADIGRELDLLDFSAAGAISGWGWYFLKNEAALLEHALVQYALSVAIRHGFQPISPPSIVYSHITAACGFQPRDQGDEQQIYTLHQSKDDFASGKPQLSLTGTAEIPFAALYSNTNIPASDLPLRVVGSSRCYRAEAGSRGINTKGLYRVHEFTKVEMFGWTAPSPDAGPATELFEQIVNIQAQIHSALGLQFRVLEQPSSDLGASATRKQDIEAYFPSRSTQNGGWGEVSSASICTDYQTRRLATRIKTGRGKMQFPHTVNGTALAVPRVIAALLETHWDAQDRCVHIPEVLWPWMHGIKIIDGKRAAKDRLAGMAS